MRILVCGSRTFSDYSAVENCLDGFHYRHDCSSDPLVVIHGGAKGADACAQRWVDGFGTEYAQECEVYFADWAAHGPTAGPLRNRLMLERGSPDVVVAFIDKPLDESRGTADMVRRAMDAGVPTYVVRAM